MSPARGAPPVERPSSAGPVSSEPVLHRTLTYRLHQLHKITDHESQQRYLAELGFSLSDGRCLATVGTFEPLSVNDLARASNLNKGQASRAAQALVERNLVEKTVDPQDGRGVVLRLTSEGRHVWNSVMVLIVQRNEEIFGCLGPQEQGLLSALFDRLLAHAQATGKP